MGRSGKAVLVTGGLGYVGSHAVLALAQAGYGVAIIDSLVNAKLAVLPRLRALSPGAQIDFLQSDLRDRAAVEGVMREHQPRVVVHFAGLKAVAESVASPELYYDNNVGGTQSLLQAMRTHGVKQLVFSSSATVYGDPLALPITESHRLAPANPYGQTKMVIEQLLAEEARADPAFRFAALRYFNPVGSHPSAQLGEDPLGVPSNLFPYLAQVAVGRRPRLRVYGNDYPTADGTGVRDYIHIMDLARGHLAALDYLDAKGGQLTANLGTGRGHSVLEAVRAFERAAGVAIPLEFAARRPGDVATCFADASLAREALGWRAGLGLDEMCRDAWRWQSLNPMGYG